jgi:hypothetical protein
MDAGLYLAAQINAINPIMNRSIRIVSTLVLISGIISCKKDSDSESNKTRLSKLVQISSANPAKNINITEFTYDDQKRVTEVATFIGDSVGSEIKSAKSRSFKCYYNGKETNPYKTVGIMSYYSNPTAEIFHTYSSSGQLVQDSIPIPSSGTNQRIIRSYTYLSNKIVVQNAEKSGTYISTTRDSFLLADHNITEAYTNMYYYQSQYNGYRIISDTKINPISKLNIAALTTTNGLFGFPSYLAPGYSNNNITEYSYGTTSLPGNFVPSGIYYYTYTYNNGNLPTECRFASNGSMYTIKYQYID